MPENTGPRYGTMDDRGLCRPSCYVRDACRSGCGDGPIDFGADFPLTPEHRASRERLRGALLNALNSVQSDPLGGNVRHNVERCVKIMNEVDGRTPCAICGRCHGALDQAVERREGDDTR